MPFVPIGARDGWVGGSCAKAIYIDFVPLEVAARLYELSQSHHVVRGYVTKWKDDALESSEKMGWLTE